MVWTVCSRVISRRGEKIGGVGSVEMGGEGGKERREKGRTSMFALAVCRLDTMDSMTVFMVRMLESSARRAASRSSGVV